MEGLAIRLMLESDIPSVVEIERMSFSTPWSETLFFNEIYNPRSTAKVAEAGNRIAGYICASQVADEGHIRDLAVHPDFREKGIAKMLAENIIGDLKENRCRFLYLEVRESNSEAINLYKTLGFNVTGSRKEYYITPKENAVIMMLRL